MPNKFSNMVATGKLLARQQTEMASIQHKGQKFVNRYFENLIDKGLIKDFEWMSITEVPDFYDFWIENIDGTEAGIIVKCTMGDINDQIQISYDELLLFTLDEFQFDLYRVYEIGDQSAKLAISKNIRQLAHVVWDLYARFPTGLTINGFSLYGRGFDLDKEIIIEIPEEANK